VCFVNLQSSLHENVVSSVCARMGNAAYVIFIMWNSISGLDTWYHFQFNISCGVAVKVISHKKIVRYFFKGRKANIFYVVFIFEVVYILRSSSFLRPSSFSKSPSIFRSS